MPDGTRTPGRSSGKTSRTGAEKWAWGELKKGKPTVHNSTTLAEYAKDFFDWDERWAVNKRSTGKRLSQRTCRDKQRLTDRHILESIGSLKIVNIDKAVIEELRNNLFKQGKSGDTINKVLACLEAILNQAEDDHLIGAIPKIEKAARNHKQRGILTPEEVKNLFSQEWPDFRAYVANLTAAATGLRMGELLALQWKSLDPGMLHIEKAWSQAERILNPTTKTGRSRYVPIPSRVESTLRELIHQSPHSNDENNFIFYSTESEACPMDGKRATNTLNKMLEKQQIDHKGRNITFHSWRHFANSIMINARIPMQKVMSVTGHLTPEMVKSYYHADDFSDVRKLQEDLF